MMKSCGGLWALWQVTPPSTCIARGEIDICQHVWLPPPPHVQVLVCCMVALGGLTVSLHTHTCVWGCKSMKRHRTPPPGGGQPQPDSGRSPVRRPTSMQAAEPGFKRQGAAEWRWRTVSWRTVVMLGIVVTSSGCLAQGIEKAEFHIKGKKINKIHILYCNICLYKLEV